MKRSTPLRRVSPKRAKQLKEYAKLRKEFLAANPICKVWLDKNPDYDDGFMWPDFAASTDIHHKKSRVGKMLLDTRYWMAVSRTAHQRIHAFPKWAREKGYLLDK